MPEFLDVCRFFDGTPIFDAYSTNLLFYGQYSNFDESDPDGNIKRRRTLSLAPHLVVPSRRAISISADRWIVGDGSLDMLNAVETRRNYWLKLATDFVNILTPAQACLEQAGLDAFVNRSFDRHTADSQSTSEHDAVWDVNFAKVEPVAVGNFLKFGGKLLRVRSAVDSDGGFLQANCDELDSSMPVTAVFEGSGAFNPVTETYANGPISQQGLLLDAYKLYNYKTQADPKVKPGDKTLVIPNSVTPVAAGSAVKVINRMTNWYDYYFEPGAATYRVVSQELELDGYMLHLRKP